MSTSLYDLNVPNYLQILGGISGVMQKGADNADSKGLFQPPPKLGELSYADLHGPVTKASEELARVSPEEIDALESKPMTFKVGDREMPFTTVNFVQSF